MKKNIIILILGLGCIVLSVSALHYREEAKTNLLVAEANAEYARKFLEEVVLQEERASIAEKALADCQSR